ncbi:MAG: hypothetical protein ACTHKU_05555 [Verrucomicrobiota bacterium]
MIFKQSLALAALISMVEISSAFAQDSPRGRGGDGSGSPNPYGRLYDTNSVETITGRVVEVEQTTPMRGMGSGVHLLVNTSEGTVPVHLGPSWFMQKQETQFKTNDQVQVTGSRVTFNNQPAVIAAEVRKDGQVLKLRDANGFPVWAGARSRGPGGSSSGMMGGEGMMRGQGMMRGNRPNPPMMCCPGMMQCPMLHHQPMMQRPRRMGAQSQEMMSEMKTLDAELKEKVETMNNVQGQEKVEAMSAVLNALLQERQLIREHMNRRPPKRDGSPECRGGSEDFDEPSDQDGEK